MLVVLSHPVVVHGFGAIVGIEDDECVVVDAEGVDEIQNAANQYV